MLPVISFSASRRVAKFGHLPQLEQISP
uniref:Uncharacterized protein n=1 Tax=Rhizophora mucronata TaxID=61149 RepID=A0A2P2JJY6_RHIMU